MKANALVDEHGNILRWFADLSAEEVMAGMTDEQKAQYLLDMERHYAQCKRIEAERRKKEAWTRRTGFNQMCYECPLLKAKCIGSKNQTWTNCLAREMHEKAAPRSGTSEKRQGI